MVISSSLIFLKFTIVSRIIKYEMDIANISNRLKPAIFILFSMSAIGLNAQKTDSTPKPKVK
jgi:hypothetical protein